MSINTAINFVTEVGLGAASSQIHETGLSPTAGYKHSSFIEQSQAARSNNRYAAIPSGSNYDPLLYYGGIQGLGRAFSLVTGINTDIVIAALSSPTLMRFIANSESFQSMKQPLTQQGWLDFCLKAVHLYLQRSSYLQVRDRVIRPIEELRRSTRDEMVQNIVDRLSDEYHTRKEAVTGIFDDSVHLVAGDISMRNLNSISEQFSTATESISLPSPLQKKYHSNCGLFSSLYAAYCVGTSLGVFSDLTPLLMCQPNMTAAELEIRAMGFLCAALLRAPTTALIGSEIAVTLWERDLEAIADQAPATVQLNRLSHRAIRHIVSGKRKVREKLYEQGITRRDLAKSERISSQVFSSLLFGLLCHSSHPLVTALGTRSFVSGTGVLLDRMGVACSSTFATRRSYFKVLPLLISTGVALASLNALSSGRAAPLVAILTSLLSSPLVTDAIASTDFYQQNVMNPLYNAVLPATEEVQNYFELDSGVSSVAELLPEKGALAPLRHLPWLTWTGKYGILAWKLFQRCQEEDFQASAASVAQQTGKAASIYSQYLFSSLIGSTIGSDKLGLISNIALIPKDKTLIPVCLGGLSALHFSDSLFLGTVSMHALNYTLRQPPVQLAAAQLGQAVLQKATQGAQAIASSAAADLTQRAQRQLGCDRRTALSNAIGIGVATAVGPVEGVLVAETVNDLLHDTAIVATASRVSRWTLNFVWQGISDLAASYNEMLAALSNENNHDY